MLPFCGYNMGDYFAHWLKLGAAAIRRSSRKIFYVNWFRKDDDGKFLWPGYGENSRVLEWIFRRLEGKADAVETPIGLVPTEGALNTDGLDLAPGAMTYLLAVDADAVRAELPQVEEHLAQFGDKLPGAIRAQFDDLKSRLG